jgi:hypothetical protein
MFPGINPSGYCPRNAFNKIKLGQGRKSKFFRIFITNVNQIHKNVVMILPSPVKVAANPAAAYCGQYIFMPEQKTDAIWRLNRLFIKNKKLLNSIMRQHKK